VQDNPSEAVSGIVIFDAMSGGNKLSHFLSAITYPTSAIHLSTINEILRYMITKDILDTIIFGAGTFK